MFPLRNAWLDRDCHQGRRWLLGLVMVGLCAVGTGCNRGPKLAAVTGRVTFKGGPVADGASILFTNPDKGTHIMARLEPDGRYRVEMAEGYGLPLGTYQVAIVPPMLTATPEMIEKYRAGGPPPDVVACPSIPVRYRKPETSQLKLELTAEGAVFDVEMTP